jgi:DNA-binding transcriptional regulator of glucitol operon
MGALLLSYGLHPGHNMHGLRSVRTWATRCRSHDNRQLTMTYRYVFAKFQLNVKPGFNFDTQNLESRYKTIPTFLTLFVFAFVYDMVLVWDALRGKNTIQIIGICIANLALLAYTALQIDQIGDSINLLHDAMEEPNVWLQVRAYLVAIPIIIGVCTIALSWIAWKLYKEFAWDILKQIGADYRMKKRFLHYQVSILLRNGFFRWSC